MRLSACHASNFSKAEPSSSPVCQFEAKVIISKHLSSYEKPVASFHVETCVLGSALGDGRFLETKDVPLSLEPAPRTIDNMDTDGTRS